MIDEGTSKTEPLPDAARAILSGLVALHGDRTVSEMLGIPRSTLARLLAGLPLRAGTRMLAMQRLQPYESEGHL